MEKLRKHLLALFTSRRVWRVGNSPLMSCKEAEDYRDKYSGVMWVDYEKGEWR